MKILMTIRKLSEKIGGNFTLFNFYDYIQEVNFFSRLFIGKSWREICCDLPKTYKIFLCICPNEKNIINEISDCNDCNQCNDFLFHLQIDMYIYNIYKYIPLVYINQCNDFFIHLHIDMYIYNIYKYIPLVYINQCNDFLFHLYFFQSNFLTYVFISSFLCLK